MSPASSLRSELRSTSGAEGEPPAEVQTAENAASRFKGIVDRFDPALGLTGWCVEFDRPQTIVELELVIDDLAIARARTGIPRADVCELIGLTGDFGFQFEPGLFDRFSAHRGILGDKRVAVRIAETRLVLPQDDQHTRLSAIFAAREAHEELDEAQVLLDRLQTLREAAQPMLSVPYRNSQGPACGYIEMIAPGANGMLWFVGWARRDHAREFPVAILDRRKYRAGAVAAAFDREDLPAEATGLVGVLRTDWRPSQAREAIFLVEDEGGGHLRATRPMRHAKIRDALAHLERASAGEDASIAQQLLALARANDGWDVDLEASSRVKVAVDSAAALEGFGVFMKGWIYSPTRAVKRLFLKLGGRQFEAHPQSLAFSGRPDLLSAFPSGREAINRAGFCCIFEMATAGSSQSEIGLKIGYDDGGVSCHSLPDVVIRRLLPDDEGGQFKEFYPHMERQALFAPYARAYYAKCQELYGDCRIDAPEPAPIQLVFAAPSERHKLYLMFEELRQNLRHCRARGVGVAILAGKDAYNGEIRELFHALRGDFAGPCSLALVEDPRFALWSLDCALVALGARRFAYVGADVVLDETGWETIASLMAAEPRLAFLEVRNPCEPWSDPERSMQAFVWTSEAFLDWRRRSRLPLGIAPSPTTEDGGAERHAACGVIDAQPSPPPTVRAINFHAGAC